MQKSILPKQSSSWTRVQQNIPAIAEVKKEDKKHTQTITGMQITHLKALEDFRQEKMKANSKIIHLPPIDFRHKRTKTEDDDDETLPPTSVMFQAKGEKGPYPYAKNIISIGIDLPILNLDDSPPSKIEDIITIWKQRFYLVQVAKKLDHAHLFQILPMSLVGKIRNWLNFLTKEQKQSIIHKGVLELAKRILVEC